jgi:hypothetical protein
MVDRLGPLSCQGDRRVDEDHWEQAEVSQKCVGGRLNPRRKSRLLRTLS